MQWLMKKLLVEILGIRSKCCFKPIIADRDMYPGLTYDQTYCDAERGGCGRRNS